MKFQICILAVIIFFEIQTFAVKDEFMNQKCANKPNCVSSYETRKSHYFPPLENVSGTWDDIKTKIEKTMNSFTHAKTFASENHHLHIVVTSSIFKFKDDVYFWWDPTENKLSFKSESRTGYWDLGANKKRLNQFVQIWNKDLKFK